MSSAAHLPCFKAYDIRGRVPEQLDAQLTEKIGRAFSAVIKPKKVVVGHDIRLSGPSLSSALTRGLRASGVDVFDLGLCGTEEIYFATASRSMDGGIMVTASHNPKDYNGMKLVREQAKPISGDTGLKDIERLVLADPLPDAARTGTYADIDCRADFVNHLLTLVDTRRMKPLKIVCNAGNGSAGAVVDALEPRLPFKLIKVHHEPDGAFPHGVPNPLLPENRAHTADIVRQEKADLGVAWDGDFDRCFFFDEQGNFIEGYYVVGLLADYLLRRENHTGEGIVLDPRLTWNTVDLVNANKGRPIVSKTGHAFIKERMRQENALYGGEMSAHHYFRNFFYCDSGMLPWLIVAEIISTRGSLSSLLAERQRLFPTSGELNCEASDPVRVLAEIESRYALNAAITRIDGVSFEYPTWRFNVRMSNTEPLVRLNIETRSDVTLLKQKTAEILATLQNLGAKLLA